MRERHLQLGCAAIAALIAATLGVQVQGQTAPSGSGQPAAPKGWKAPRTAWGHPDLQGLWDNGTTTPLERPAEFAGREFLTDKELAERAHEVATRAEKRPTSAAADVELAYNNEWWERGTPLKRTSLIIDPPDGRLPALTEKGKQIVAAREEVQAQPGTSGLVDGPAAAGALHPLPRRAAVSDRLQQPVSDRADSAARRHPLRDDGRDADDSSRRTTAPERRDSPVDRQRARALGGRHAGCRNHRIQRQDDVPLSRRRTTA